MWQGMLAAVVVAATVMVASGAESAMRGAAFVAAVRCERPPAVDGSLDDPAWQAAPTVDLFYEYLKPQPGPGQLATGMRMLYDEQGVYLGVVNFDDAIDKLRAVYTGRDAEDLWKDDCNEIYFDAAGSGIGWTKFVVNSVGTMGDSRRIDPAVSLPEWNGSGWQVKTSRRADAWIVEAFFPWSDLGERRAEPGTVWRFCLVRYAYTSGKFVGVSSSPGGYYNAPQNFGAMLFGGAAAPDAAKIAAAVEATAAPPWFLPLEGGMLECLARRQARFVSVREVSDRIAAEDTQLAARVAALAEADQAAAEVTQLAAEFRDLRATAPAALPADAGPRAVQAYYAAQADIRSRLSDIYWRMKIQELLSTGP